MTPVMFWLLLSLAVAVAILVLGGLGNAGYRGVRSFVDDLVEGLRRVGRGARAVARREAPAPLVLARGTDAHARPVDTSVADIFTLGHDEQPAYVSSRELGPVVQRALDAVERRAQEERAAGDRAFAGWPRQQRPAAGRPAVRRAPAQPLGPAGPHVQQPHVQQPTVPAPRTGAPAQQPPKPVQGAPVQQPAVPAPRQAWDQQDGRSAFDVQVLGLGDDGDDRRPGSTPQHAAR